MSDYEVIDSFLATALTAVLEERTLPAWPQASRHPSEAILQRISFHGIALFLTSSDLHGCDWPEQLCIAIRTEARQQALWEVSHARTVAKLLEALHSQEVDALVMKGTALAYSVYPDPALRRRGDTDLVIETRDRDRVRSLFSECGFSPVGDRRALQESWIYVAGDSFAHEVDLHWAPSASAAVSARLQEDAPSKRSRSLPRLAVSARAMGSIDSLIQICINRAAHQAFGYGVDDAIIRDGDRLIWAVDLHLIAQELDEQDWSRLGQICRNIGASSVVADGLQFATNVLGTPWRREIFADKKASAPEEIISDYFQSMSSAQRAASDFASAGSIPIRLRLLKQHLLPGREFLENKYPGSQSRSIWRLRFRRIRDGVVGLILPRR